MPLRLRALARPSPLLFFFGAALSACSAAPPAESTAESASPIISGQPSTSADDAVVMLENLTDLGGYECTGTLLASNLVITARHCVSPPASEAPFACDQNGKVAAGDASFGADVTPSHLVVRVGATRPPDTAAPAARGALILHDSSTVLCNHDLALVVLDTKIPGAKIVPVRLDDSAAPGESTTDIGWGVTGTTELPATRMRRAGVQVVQVGPGANASLQVEIGPSEFLVGETTCQGDSGGPALDAATGALVGVLSRGGNGTTSTRIADSCTGAQTANFFTEPAPFKSLLLQGYAAAGADPWNEGDPGPAPVKTQTMMASSAGGCAAAPGGRSSGTWLALFALIALPLARRRSKR